MKEPINNFQHFENESNFAQLKDDNAVISKKEDFAQNAPDLQVEHDTQVSNENDAKDFIFHSTKRDSVRDYKAERKNKKHRHKKKKSKLKKVLITLLCVFLGLIIAAAGIFAVFYYMGKNSLLDNSGMNLIPPDSDTKVIDNGNYINYKGHVYRYKDTMTSILFMGVDKTEELGTVNNVVGTGGQADALYLMAIDTSNGTTTTFQISRSAMCDINLYTAKGDFISTENAQICLSYAYGDGKETSAENCITSVRRLFYGLPVAQSYLALDIAGISKINDSIGGIEVTSPVTLTLGENTLYQQGQTYNLLGEDAESFVRSRNDEEVDSNTNRMERQKAYLDAFVAKAISMTKENITTPIDIYNGAEPYMVTNINASKVSYLAVDMLRKGVTNVGIEKVPGKDKEGKNYVEYHINHKKFFQMIVDTFYVQAD